MLYLFISLISNGCDSSYLGSGLVSQNLILEQSDVLVILLATDFVIDLVPVSVVACNCYLSVPVPVLCIFPCEGNSLVSVVIVLLMIFMR